MMLSIASAVTRSRLFAE